MSLLCDNKRNVDIKERILKEYIDNSGVNHFASWFDTLDSKIQQRVDARLARVRAGNLGDYKPLKDGVFELRFKFGPGYRVYFGLVGDEVVLLLVGGDKGSQNRDIKKAKKFWQEFLKDGN